MPYKVVKEEDEWAVYKLDAEGKPTGKALGKHKSEDDAKRQMKALYANENKEADDDHTKMYGYYDETAMAYIPGPTSFADLLAQEAAQESAHEVHELTYKFQMLARNIMAAGEIEDKGAALTELANEYAGLVGEAMEMKERKWQPLTDAAKKMVDRVKAAFSSEEDDRELFDFTEWMTKAAKFLMGYEMTLSTKQNEIVEPIVGVIAVDMVDDSTAIHHPAFLTARGPAAGAFVRSFINNFSQPAQVSGVLTKDASAFLGTVMPIRSPDIVLPLVKQLTATSAFNQDLASSLSFNLISVPLTSALTRTKSTEPDTAFWPSEILAAVVAFSSDVGNSSVSSRHKTSPKYIVQEYYTTKQNGLQDHSTLVKAVWSTSYVNTFPDGSFLYIKPGCGEKDSDGKTKPRSCRMFPVKDASGKPDLPHIRNAIARIPQADIPADKKTSLQERARRMLADAQKEMAPVYIWKENDQYRAILAYTNNFRDEDNPAEIISSAANKEFDEALNKGEWPMPELWLWHIPYPVGRVITHAYDNETGFSVAGAVFDKDKEWAAEGVIKAGWDGVSHGMPKTEIQRDENDPTVITRRRTKEVSILPDWAAANKLSFHLISKEQDDMETKGIPAQKRDEFIKAFGADRVEAIEQALADRAKEAQEAGIENKETGTPAPQTEAQPAQATSAQQVDMTELAKTIAAAVQIAIAPVAEAVNQLEAEVKGLKQTDEEKIAAKAANTPRASLEAMVAAQMGDLFSKANQVNERSSLVKGGPKETPVEQDQGEGLFFMPWLRPNGQK